MVYFELKLNHVIWNPKYQMELPLSSEFFGEFFWLMTNFKTKKTINNLL